MEDLLSHWWPHVLTVVTALGGAWVWVLRVKAQAKEDVRKARLADVEVHEKEAKTDVELAALRDDQEAKREARAIKAAWAAFDEYKKRVEEVWQREADCQKRVIDVETKYADLSRQHEQLKSQFEQLKTQNADQQRRIEALEAKR